MMINKKDILDELKKIALKNLSEAEFAYHELSSYKNSPDMKQEGKYDTRSIEAGALAGAQKKRVDDLKLEIELIETIPLKYFKALDEITIGALVEIEINKMKRWYFVSSTAGGSLLQVNGLPILVISAFSPMGSELIGLKINDSFEIETQSGMRNHTILQLI